MVGRRRIKSGSKVKGKIVPLTWEVLKLIGAVTLIGGVMMVPATAIVVTPVLKFAKEKMEENEELKNTKFDKVRLWLILHRLERQKDVEISETAGGETTVKLTEKGRVRFLKYKLEQMPQSFAKKNWDGRWRIIVFDVPEKERGKRDNFRNFLNSLKFYQLQESVYLAPYPCEKEIEFLRQYYGLGKKVQVLVSSGLEDDSAYKAYFGVS